MYRISSVLIAGLVELAHVRVTVRNNSTRACEILSRHLLETALSTTAYQPEATDKESAERGRGIAELAALLCLGMRTRRDSLPHMWVIAGENERSAY
jgi:hypothetical protein